MLDQLRTFIETQLQSNQFLVGGFVLGALAGIIHQCKEIPSRIWDWVKSRFIIEIIVTDRDAAFLWVEKWLALHPYGKKRARLLTVRTERHDDGNQPSIILSPAPGYHWFFYKRRLISLHREEQDSSKEMGGMKVMGVKEKFAIKLFTKDRQLAIDLLEEARELVHPKTERKLSILKTVYGDWEIASTRRPRPLASVVLKAGTMEELIVRVERFLASEQWYIDRGIPWRLGVLLKGPPGSGKSSAVLAIASHFNKDIAVLNLTGSKLDDNELRDCLATVPQTAVLLIEDIDCVFDRREATEEESKITFSGLLNAIDGVAAGEGRVLFMTTNHPEKLDPALIRPGRADLRIEIGAPDAGQASRMFERFFPKATSSQNLRFIEALPKETSMAAIQGHLTNYADDAEKAIRFAADAAITTETPL